MMLNTNFEVDNLPQYINITPQEVYMLFGGGKDRESTHDDLSA